MASRQNRSSPDGSSQGSSAAGNTEPPATAGGSPVRRAVALGSVGADPALIPAPAAAPSAGAAGRGGEGTGRSRPGTAPDEAAAPARSGAAGTTGEAAAGATAATAATRQRTEPEAAGGTATRGQGAPDAAAASVAGGVPGDASARGDGEPPSGRPKKPILAAAGLAGAVLLAVPLLIWATDDSGDRKVSVAAAADPVLEDAPLSAPQGTYAPAKPSADPKAKAKAKPSPKAKAAAPLQNKAPEAPVTPTPSKEAKKPAEKSAAKKKAPKPAPNTAALAVQRLAAQSPGRHICYRVYVADAGWQPAACDGAMAGSEGQGRPIKAINFSVAGTHGIGATGYFQSAGYTKPWTGAVDGGDAYIGTPQQSGLNIAGFAINVDQGGGTICQNVHINDAGWAGLACDTPGTSDNFIFGGTLDQEKHWLEAVRFTV